MKKREIVERLEKLEREVFGPVLVTAEVTATAEKPDCVPDGAPWQEVDGHVMWFDGDGVSVFDEKAPKFPWLYRDYSSSIFAGALGQPVADACARFLKRCQEKTRETEKGDELDRLREQLGASRAMAKTREDLVDELREDNVRLRAENERLQQEHDDQTREILRLRGALLECSESAIAIASAALEAES